MQKTRKFFWIMYHFVLYYMIVFLSWNSTMEQFVDKFIQHYGFEPTAAACAPGRLEILGNHTDYNQGITLSCAVGNNTRCALRPNGSTWCRVKDFRSGDEMTFDLSRPDDPPERNGSRYIKGVAVELMKLVIAGIESREQGGKEIPIV